ncbi:hypothetical protein F6U93_08425 [Tamlana haliotis]|uniref:Type I restriction modification DNA specificity domain-containing protein n=1 Tax=Pseudotamlana haliotis TaxID=2614804 RepID=A0A6N6MF06_9FLAO|nr:restriction endonuclease subunit S [Tamlana haliotis]KAB1067957.1 hypothetical protein F6U93_08425 [Tamlana haliotis]
MSWENTNLLNVTSKIGDGLHGTPKYDENGEYYFINGNNLKQGKVEIKAETKKIGEEEYQKIKKELNDRTVFVSINGTLGNVGIYNDEKIALGKSACYLNINQDVSKLYIRYILESEKFQSYAEAFATGSTIKNLGLKAIRNYEFPLPPLPTQKKIASILSAYDDLIENNLKRIQLLEETAQRLYKEWFVDFKFPNHENTPINEETGLPEGWEEKLLNEISEVKSSKRIYSSDYVDKGVLFYRGKEITLKTEFKDVREPFYISEEKFNTLKNKFGAPVEGDILITSVGTIGNVYRVNKFDKEFYFKDGNLIWITNISEEFSIYLISYFKSLEFKNIIKSISIGSSQKAFTISSIRKIEINLPTDDLLIDFQKLVKPIFSEQNILSKKNSYLKEARDLLLPRLMNRTLEV